MNRHTSRQSLLAKHRALVAALLAAVVLVTSCTHMVQYRDIGIRRWTATTVSLSPSTTAEACARACGEDPQVRGRTAYSQCLGRCAGARQEPGHCPGGVSAEFACGERFEFEIVNSERGTCATWDESEIRAGAGEEPWCRERTEEEIKPAMLALGVIVGVLVTLGVTLGLATANIDEEDWFSRDERDCGGPYQDPCEQVLND